MTRADARRAVDEIIKDLSDRAGLSGVWDGVDEETRAEIKSAWVAIILLSQPVPK